MVVSISLFWWKKPCFKWLQHVSFKEPCFGGLQKGLPGGTERPCLGLFWKPSPELLFCLGIPEATTQRGCGPGTPPKENWRVFCWSPFATTQKGRGGDPPRMHRYKAHDYQVFARRPSKRLHAVNRISHNGTGWVASNAFGASCQTVGQSPLGLSTSIQNG